MSLEPNVNYNRAADDRRVLSKELEESLNNPIQENGIREKINSLGKFTNENLEMKLPDLTSERISTVDSLVNDPVVRKIEEVLGYRDASGIRDRLMVDTLLMDKPTEGLQVLEDQLAAYIIQRDAIAKAINKSPLIANQIMEARNKIAYEGKEKCAITVSDGKQKFEYHLQLVGGTLDAPSLIIREVDPKSDKEGSFKKYFYSVADECVQARAFLTIKNEPPKKEGKAAQLLNEVTTQILLNEKKVPHVPKILKFDEEKQGEVFLVMENYRTNGFDAVVDKKLKKGEENKIGVAIAETLEQMHKLNIVHWDIKPDNIFLNLDEKGAIKDPLQDIALGDYGFATKLEGGNPISSGKGTPHYAALEIFQRNPVGKPADIYSLGCTLFALATGKQIFLASDKYRYKYDQKKEVRYFIDNLCIALQLRRTISPKDLEFCENFSGKPTELARALLTSKQFTDDEVELYTMIFRMTQSNPALRPEAKEVKEFYQARVART